MARKQKQNDAVTLNSWKQMSPTLLMRHFEELLGLVASLTPTRSPAEQEAVASALEHQGQGGVAIAQRLEAKRNETGLSWSWVALAALNPVSYRNESNENYLAAQLLGTKLIVLADDWDRRHGSRLLYDTISNNRANPYLPLAHEWLQRAGMKHRPVLTSVSASIWTAFGDEVTLVGKAVAALPVVTSAAHVTSRPQRAVQPVKPAKEPAPVALPLGTPSLVVCRDEIVPMGRAVKDTGEIGLVETWRFLNKPLELAVGPKPEVLQAVLSAEFPWLSEAITAIVDDLVLRRRMGVCHARFRPLLLVGPPGTGKTRFARRVAELLGTGFAEVQAGGSSDNRALQGTARGWGTASPSAVLHAMRRTRTANPVILVDELDKAGADDRNGTVKATLLSMLEGVTAKAWPDECLMVPCDLSQVNWIATANDATRLRGPLLTRLRVVECRLPGANHAEALLAGIRRDLAAEWDVPAEALPDLPAEAQAALLAGCRRGVSVRRLRSAVEGAIRVALDEDAGASAPMMH